MTNFLRHSLLGVSIVFILCGCDQTHTQDDGHDLAAKHAHGEPNPAESDGHAADQHGNDPGSGVDGVIQLDKHELDEFGIHLIIAGPGSLKRKASLSGEIALNPDRVAHVVSRAGGIGSKILHTIGDHIEAGEMLAILESPELAESKAEYLARSARAALDATDLARAESIYSNTIRLLEIVAENPDVDTLRKEISGLDIGVNRGDLITTYAELRAARAIYQREKTLFERGISSESEYILAESAYKKAVAGFQAVRDDLAFSNRRGLEAARRTNLVANVSLEAAERRLHALGLSEEDVKGVESESDLELARYEIRAPLGGLIIERHLVRGESIEAGEQIFVISDLSSVWGHLTLYQRDLANIRKGQKVGVLGAHNLAQAEAIIEYINPILDEQTRTTTARVELDNADGAWRPGMFIRGELIISEHSVAIMVPRSALQEIDQQTFLFVEDEDGIEPRKVRIGRMDDDSAEILSGLNPGDRYVISGGLALKAQLNKGALEHAGHAH